VVLRSFPDGVLRSEEVGRHTQIKGQGQGEPANLQSWLRSAIPLATLPDSRSAAALWVAYPKGGGTWPEYPVRGGRATNVAPAQLLVISKLP